LFGLENIDKDVVSWRMSEQLQISREPALMNAREIASRGLERGRELDHIDIARFHFGLDEKVQYPPYASDQKSKQSDFRLNNNRLVPFRNVAPIRTDPKALNAEEASTVVPEVACAFVKMPLAQVGERYLLDLEPVRALTILPPSVNTLNRRHLALQREGRFYEQLSDRIRFHYASGLKESAIVSNQASKNNAPSRVPRRFILFLG
jgi:hypothetical protein